MYVYRISIFHGAYAGREEKKITGAQNYSLARRDE